MCTCTVTYMALCALAPQRSTTSFSVCVRFSLFLCIYPFQSQELPKLCYFVLLFFITMTVKFFTIQLFDRHI